VVGVEVVPVGVGVVAGVVGAEVVVEVVVGVVVVLVVAVVVAVVVGVVVVAVVAWQRWRSWLTVETPLLRSARRLLLTVEGRLASSETRACAALRAAAQLPAAIAVEILSSWLLSALAGPAGSRPAPPPQPAMNDTAKPSPPARSAREK
jgi:hypothetical protein